MFLRNTQVTLYKFCTFRLRGREDFHTVMPAPALLGKGVACRQSMHQAANGLLKGQQEAANKGKDAWQANLL